MLDHVGINCSDLPASAAFYDGVLGALGFTRVMDFPEAIGYGDGKPDFWIAVQPAEGLAAGPNREGHFAFQAQDAAAVRGFFEAAKAQGAEVLHEPRFFPEYHDAYYGAFVRDPDGNNVEAVCHTVQPGDELPG
jgi:catechol 2,3-dioxygenase-like lactoylglutathione lyase family enzyme